MAARIDAWQIPTPFPVGAVNAYRLPGRRPALVDAGPRTSEAAAALLALLETNPVEVLVVTHDHVDHAGLARTLQRDHGVRVLVHRTEASPLRRWTTDAAAREADYEAGLRAAGVPSEQRERMRYGGRKYDAWGDAVEADETFAGGDRLLLGDSQFDVVDAPGHTAGSFLLTDGADTFSGDTLLEHITPNAVSVRASERGALVDYVATLGRLHQRDWGTVHPGHGRPFQDAQDVIRKGLLHARRRQERVLRELRQGPSTAFEMVARLFPRLPKGELFLAVSEALGHLEYLRHDGRVRARSSLDVDRYELVDATVADA